MTGWFAASSSPNEPILSSGLEDGPPQSGTLNSGLSAVFYYYY